MQESGPEHDDSFDFLFKIILIGDTNVGKTCVVQNFKSGVFSEKQQNTIGVDFTVRTLDIEGKKVKVGLHCDAWFCMDMVTYAHKLSFIFSNDLEVTPPFGYSALWLRPKQVK